MRKQKCRIVEKVAASLRHVTSKALSRLQAQSVAGGAELHNVCVDCAS